MSLFGHLIPIRDNEGRVLTFVQKIDYTGMTAQYDKEHYQAAQVLLTDSGLIPVASDAVVNKDEYKSDRIVVTSTEQEIDLGAEFDELTFYNKGKKPIELKLNDSGNDVIWLDPRQGVAVDFIITKFFCVANSGNSLLQFMVTR